MDTKQKIQRVLDVIDGKSHPSVLVEILPKPDEDGENVIKLAVDFIVARALERANAPASSYFRFRVTESLITFEGEEKKVDKKEVHVSDWFPERTQLSAPMKMAEIRQLYPRGEITVERSYHSGA